MCLYPKKIINRSNHWDESQPVYMYVPCGKCEECKNSVRNDWFVRLYYQWRTSVLSLFYTLTYNNESLPHQCGMPCFDKKHIQDFMKRLRYYLNKEGVKCKYMICCEYGEKFGRPHYHAYFSLDTDITLWRFYRLIQKCWIHGFVQPGDGLGRINREAGLKYVTKYITKDFGYEENRKTYQRICYNRINNLLDYYFRRYDFRPLSLRLTDCGVSPYNFLTKKLTDDEKVFIRPFVQKFNKWYRSFVPFHLQSTHLGAMFLADTHALNYDKEVLTIVSGNGMPVKYSLPRYFKRKIWYDCVEDEKSHKNTKFVLNDAGLQHYIVQRCELAERKKQQYYTLTDASCIKYLTDDVFNQFTHYFQNEIEPTKVFFQNRHSLSWFLNMMREDLDFDVLAKYATFLRGRICLWQNDDVLDFIKNDYKEYIQFHISKTSEIDVGKLYELECRERAQFETFLHDKLPIFQPYEFALAVLEAWSKVLDVGKSTFIALQEARDKKVREILKPIF